MRASARTVKTFGNEVADVRERARKAEVARHEGLAPLRWLASLTDGSLSFDPSFPVEGSFQVPRTSERRVLAIVALLRTFYHADNRAKKEFLGALSLLAQGRSLTPVAAPTEHLKIFLRGTASHCDGNYVVEL